MNTAPDPVPSDVEMVPPTPAASGPFTQITSDQLRLLAATDMSIAGITASVAASAGFHV